MMTLNLVLVAWNYLRESYEKLNNSRKEKGHSASTLQPLKQSQTLESK